MKKLFKIVLILICVLTIVFGFIACNSQEIEVKLPDESSESLSSPTNDISTERKDNNEYQEQKIDSEQLYDYYKFVSNTYQCVISERENSNAVYAPISFYVSLAMLSEMTNEKTKMELYDALGFSDYDNDMMWLNKLINDLTKRAPNNKDEIFGRLNLDTSFWLQDTIRYNEDIMNKISKNFRAEAFVGDFQDPEFQKQMTSWVSEKTSHSFQPQFSDLVNSTEQNSFCVISTLDFWGEWRQVFKAENEEEAVFFCNDGSQVECMFMNSKKDYAPYLKDDDYISTELYFVTGEEMIFILPNEEQPFSDFWQGNRLSDIISAWEKENYDVAKLNLSVPRFSCSDCIDLEDIAEKLHINLLFDSTEEVFAPFSDTPIFITDIKQEATISIDEMGCSVSAYTATTGQSAAPEQAEEIDINLNRPFYYILCKDGIPFLIGQVHNPVEK